MIGKQAETQASEFLQSAGYRILDRNVRHGRYELDIVALDLNTDEVVFVEVKARGRAARQRGIHPVLAVTTQKIHRLERVATHWIRQHRLYKRYRFDIISVLEGSIEHFKHITWVS